MGKIKKVPSGRHNATASPEVTDFIAQATAVPLTQLRQKLSEFPTHWPLPRGDLYHWIPLLDRFDTILELFNKEYGLDQGPQTQPFGRRLLERGDSDEPAVEEDTSKRAGAEAQDDLQLVEDVLRFTRVLLEKCGNRSLYASSSHINNLLNTTSLTLLQASLQLSLRLAQRYQVARFKNPNQHSTSALMASHYSFDLDNLQRIALPIPRPHQSVSAGKQKEKQTLFQPNDLVSIAGGGLPAATVHELSEIMLTDKRISPRRHPNTAVHDETPASPTPASRVTSTPRPAPSGRTNSSNNADESYFPHGIAKSVHITADKVQRMTAHELVKDITSSVDADRRYEALQAVRVAKAFSAGHDMVMLLLQCRLLAVSNLAYALSDSKFHEKIAGADNDEPRQYHMAQQLCDLLQATNGQDKVLSVVGETVVLDTLESLAKTKAKQSEVVDALAVSVNHGVLYYELRRAVNSLKKDDNFSTADGLNVSYWRGAVFDLVTTISQINVYMKCADRMVNAGIIDILVEALTLRTSGAERTYEKVIGFLSSFVHGISTAFQALANARGFEIISELANQQTLLAIERVNAGKGTTDEKRSKVIDYRIPYYQQATLRSIFKFIVYLFDHNAGANDRVLRNLLDSPQTLNALRLIIANSHLFGSNVWDAAINTVTNFIHNEPTSFQIVAESGLARGILEAVLAKPISETESSVDAAEVEVVTHSHFSDPKGILPVSETICDIPTAFGAICLNEEGMRLFRSSGALNAFFDIFLSPAHVQVFEEETQTAFTVGNAFDELSRHHPDLKDEILDAVVRMLERVRDLANDPTNLSSGRLWNGDQGQPSDAWEQGGELTRSELFNRLSDPAPAMPYISACLKFLEGFLNNSSMCQRFCRLKGAQLVMAIVLSPAVPYDFTFYGAHSKAERVLHRMCEEKPHLVLPSILAQTLLAIESLRDYSDSTFTPDLVWQATDESSLRSLSSQEGQSFIHAFVNLGLLCNVLSGVFISPNFGGSRNSGMNTILANLDFSDVYVRIVSGLGKLASACTWDNLELASHTPEAWKAFSDHDINAVVGFGECIAHQKHGCLACKFENAPSIDELLKSLDADRRTENIIALKNLRTIRFLLTQVPRRVSTFFSHFSACLAPKRLPEGRPRQMMHYMAEKLADALFDLLVYRRDRAFEYVTESYALYAIRTVYGTIQKSGANVENFAQDALTLVLLKFYNAQGFKELDRHLTECMDICNNSMNPDQHQLGAVRSCINMILNIYAQVTSSKFINDAPQSLLITKTGTENPDYFSPNTFLVELRYTVMKSIASIWRSADLSKIGKGSAKLLIEIVRNVLRADGEDRSAKAIDKLQKLIRPTPPLSNSVHCVDEMMAKPDGVLGIEASWRCCEQTVPAVEYYDLVYSGGAPRMTPPSVETTTPYDAKSMILPSDEATNDEAMPLSKIKMLYKGDYLPVLHISESREPFITSEDLDRERSDVRDDLIDRSLDILSSEPTLTFELADLIQAAVAKSGEHANPRADIGKTLVSSLLSLQCEGENDETAKKITGYAHLVALILQDRDFFEATLDELKEYFDSFVSWIQLAPDQTIESAPWINMILLILERILAEDEQPIKRDWISPPADDPFKVIAVPEPAPPVVSMEHKATLFDAVMNLLPKIGKDHSLALSVMRVLVILTRTRDLARRLEDKLLMSRLFLMVRQVSLPLGEKLQTAIMVVLRHVVEDDAVMERIMRTEIKTFFETPRGNGPRYTDTTSYLQSLYHLVLRNPKLFTEITKDMVEINNYNGSPARPQYLVLKKTATEAPQSEDAMTVQPSGNASGTAAVQDLQMPSGVGTDGVIHFLLRELSNFREVDDKPIRSKQMSKPAERPENEFDTEDVDMPTEPTENEVSEQSEDSTLETFKADENIIYIYRCFLLQCLAELLACYSRCKIDFINFSRKGENVSTTPSKPRSGTINYLLTQLLPLGTLEHLDTSAHRKKAATAGWATTVLVALCSQTHEQPYFERHASRTPDLKPEEPDLAYVRRFVLEHALRAFKDAVNSTEERDMRYSRMLALADLFERMLSAKQDRSNPIQTAIFARSAPQIGRLMYEKNFVGALTSSIAEIDLDFANAKRAVKHILVPLKNLTNLAVDLSQRGELSSGTNSTSSEGEEISSATSISDPDEDEEREQTPDLFRNSALSMFEASADIDEGSGSESNEDDDEDEEMYDDEFEADMSYEDDNGETVSDDELEGMHGIGNIEGLPGDVDMEIQVIHEGEEIDDDDEDTDSADEMDDNEDDVDEVDDEDDGGELDSNESFVDGMQELEGEDDNASMADIDEAWEDGATYSVVEADGEAHSPGEGPLEHLAHVLAGGDVFHGRRLRNIHELADTADLRDEDEEDDEEDVEEEGDEEVDGDLAFEPEADEDDEDAGWGIHLPPPRQYGSRMHHRARGVGNGFENLMSRVADLNTMPMRFHARTTHGRDFDEGMNPLLQRGDSMEQVHRHDRLPMIAPPPHMFTTTDGRRGLRALPHHGEAILGDLLNAMHRYQFLPHNGDISRITVESNNGTLMEIDPGHSWRESVGLSLQGPSRSSHNQEAAAVEFKPTFTAGRWEDEARILFGIRVRDKATRVLTTLFAILMPPAMEAKRVKDAEEAAKKKEADEIAKQEALKAEQEKTEREAKEKQEREEQEARDRAAREEVELNAQLANIEANAQDTEMEDVARVTTDTDASDVAVEPAATSDRIMTTIRGRDIDITDLGIDHEYLQALPEEFREEVIMSQLTEQRSQARQAGEAPENISPEFLEALPPDLQQELIRQEQADRRRREREARRQNADNGQVQPSQAQDLDPGDFLAMLEPSLRQQILIDAHEDEGILNSLPEEFQREARILGERRAPVLARRMIQATHPRIIDINTSERQAEQTAERARPKQVVQMLDKAGVATLLRLMFVHLHHKAKTSLHAVLSDVCKNTQNRAEVISILLTILQECTADVNAVERSFAQLSLRAKQQSGPKTPQPLKRVPTADSSLSTELSPLTIVQHCLGTLAALSNDNPKVQTFFLSEHETLASQKAKSAKKGKSKDIKASKYPLNALLTLLDRKLITENTGVMETLAALLSRVTLPLQILLKKAKEGQDAARAAETAEPPAESTSAPDPMEISTMDVRMQEEASTQVQGSGPEPTDAQASEQQVEKKKRSPRELEPPNVPEENIRLVVNILAARECPSKTFSDTLDIIKHMAAIPGAKEIFGRELIRQAQDLGADVVADLNALADQITSAQASADIQGVALASFSSTGSKQRKLLRILVALDHLFDARRMAQSGDSSVDAKLKGDILATLYESDNFQNLWKTLSACLTAIRQRGDMVNIATILLPLIESLMVVCRNSHLKDAPLTASQADLTVGTPPPEARMEGLFFNFTEEHRKILNELIRHNPKLMNGNLSVLAKNSKVLEFDNKRSYFNRKLHSRGSEARSQHPALTLNVRRDQAFMDSYKALYYKSGDEIKYGKLNVRFNGEEGIDAGGVSREWMAVLSRQMFNPDYALFNPVASDRTTFHPNSLSDINTEHLSFFKFIGRIIGKALYEGRVLDCHFSRAVYRRILGKSVSLKDMETLDLEYYKSLVWILENDITDITFETFSVEVDRFGVVEVVDLVENGRNIPVTEENKHDYVRLVVEHRLVKSVQEQLNAFLGGFHDIIPSELISIFNEQELELLISGLPNIDVDDWKNNTEYHNFTTTSAQIQWFWRAVKSFDDEERAKLLQFVTGTSKVPLNGFKELEGMNGFARFNIHRDYSSKDRLPTSHTCFNQLDLPEYESYEQLRQHLQTAITAGSEYFGFA